MAIRASKFTPEVLLSAPRRSAGLPNANASSVLYTTSTYSFDTHKKVTEVRVLDVESNESRLVTDEEGISEPQWLGDGIICLRSVKEGKTEVVVGPLGGSKNHYQVAGTIDGPASNLKIRELEDGVLAIAVSAQATPDGSLYNPETAPKPRSTGKLYNSLFVRHWDAYKTPEKNAIWYGTLSKSKDGKYELSKLTNALKGTGLESPIPPFGGADNFDISSSGIIFVAKDPELNPALNTKCNVYFIPISSFIESSTFGPHKVQVPNFEGAASSPVFSADGKKAAFLMMRQNGYEADKNQIFLIPNVGNASWIMPLLDSEDGKGTWECSPQSVCFSHDGESLLLTVEEKGKGLLYVIPKDPFKGAKSPRNLTWDGYVSDVRCLPSGDVFVSGSTLIDNSAYLLIDPSNAETPTLISSNSRNGATFGLRKEQVSEIWFPAADPLTNKKVHAWVVKPSDFDDSKKYPLAYLIHGGPQGSWADSWSTRWNPAVFAEQGYIVICPNPTGSTGYGQAFCDAINQQWGGLPYQDIVNGFTWIKDNMSEVDCDRAVALGASYGGYMMNWIQGHDLGRQLKALVTHDGVFSMTGQLASEELYFPFHDLGGAPWHNRGAKSTSNFAGSSLDAWREWDPSQHIDKWATPQLVIHNELDYRLTISEGLSAFNVLQARGVESQFLVFPDENHWVLKPENSLVWHRVVLNFINKFVGLPKFFDGEEGGLEFLGGERMEGEVVKMEAAGNGHT
ncbi:hypothetical protein B0A49_05931 [Cryomyces minteri]|uniref:Dipeptidyl-peptidase V n=1 Tax=Cryomyces minteri TaxID=331657 RepID=A0A4U0WY81_9PEZI|nr:hypothetical protein B0A49_05931 [Cryomyces minteri]